MKRFWIVAIALIMVIALCGCKDKNSEEQAQGPQSPTFLKTAELADGVSDMAFDFADFPEAGFPRGLWTIDQLTERYGAGGRAVADYLADYGAAFVTAEFPDLRVYFFPGGAGNFSFYTEGLAAGDYELSEGDKGLQYEILSLHIYSSLQFKLPYGIEIGTSTRDEILNIYPEGAGFTYRSEEGEDFFDLVSYYYGFSDEGSGFPEGYSDSGLPGNVNYFMDGNGVLSSVNVDWYYFDL